MFSSIEVKGGGKGKEKERYEILSSSICCTSENSGRRKKEETRRGKHDKLPSLTPISAILSYEWIREVRRDLSTRFSRTFFLLPTIYKYQAVFMTLYVYRVYAKPQQALFQT